MVPDDPDSLLTTTCNKLYFAVSSARPVPFLNVCDKLGLLVPDESFDCWKWGKNGNDYSKYFGMW
jgi:hypothetical protein